MYGVTMLVANQLVTKFITPESPLPCSQEPTTAFYPETDERSPHHHTQVLLHPFINTIILLFMSRSTSSFFAEGAEVLCTFLIPPMSPMHFVQFILLDFVTLKY
jgi:hypothetical protein